MRADSQFASPVPAGKGEAPHPSELFGARREPLGKSTSLAWQLQALRSGQWEVFYDGDCGFCRRWAARGRRWCNPLIQWRNFREHCDEVAHLNPHFDQAAYLIINRQIALPGFFAFRKLALASPKLWPLLPLAYFPGSAWLGPRIYHWIARRYGPASNPQAICQ